METKIICIEGHFEIIGVFCNGTKVREFKRKI